MFTWRLLYALLVSGLTMYTHIRGDAGTTLSTLFKDFHAWRLEDTPQFANHGDSLWDLSTSRMIERRNTAEHFLENLEQIDQTELSASDLISYRILNQVLTTYIKGFKWSRFGLLNPLDFLEGIQLDPDQVMQDEPFLTRADYDNFIVRLQNTPFQVNQYIELCRSAIAMDGTSSNSSVDRVPTERLDLDPEHSALYQPFAAHLQQLPMDIQVKRDLRGRAHVAILGVLNTLYLWKTFLEKVNLQEHIPNTRPKSGAGSFLFELDYYKACLEWHLSIDMSPERVHQIGLQEIERIKGLIDKVMEGQNFSGSAGEFFAMFRNKTSLHLQTEDELLETYQKIVNETVKPRLPEMFKNLPDLPLKVKAMENDGPLAMYAPMSADGSRPGTFFINLHRSEERGTYVMVPITLHESIPGHHLQTSYELKAIPPSIQHKFHFPYYTAYIEGWATYAESLGEELNLYQDATTLMGRYSLEMVRACRLVVDTGLHYYGWSPEDAIQYMLNYTTLPRVDITKEVDRYIGLPGQACAYKIGEIKIKELRKRAQDALGEQFDIRDFHSVVLENGPVPLTILEEIVDDWILNYNSSSTTAYKSPTAEEANTDAAYTQHVSFLMALCLTTLSLTSQWLS
ncbi:uncharacterized protein LOC124285646 [Haliotis rubra]|uniref:uncharacterized protein LOC124285646 n=1 Tax=Haliotis rubra TaxID=36100 RepID=UPI001EE501D7|nr:uncharacterized protein LOC124285646 [Haliotis rubra]